MTGRTQAHFSTSVWRSFLYIHQCALLRIFSERTLICLHTNQTRTASVIVDIVSHFYFISTTILNSAIQYIRTLVEYTVDRAPSPSVYVCMWLGTAEYTRPVLLCISTLHYNSGSHQPPTDLLGDPPLQEGRASTFPPIPCIHNGIWSWPFWLRNPMRVYSQQCSELGWSADVPPDHMSSRIILNVCHRICIHPLQIYIYPVTMVSMGYHCGLSVIYHGLN